MNTEPLLPAAFLFRFAAPCLYLDAKQRSGKIELPESHRLPCFAELDEEPVFADVRAGWNEQGLAFSVSVRGKRQPPWCRASRMEDSDGLAVWIDTRDTHNVHRATRFCHAFRFLPTGGGSKSDQPIAAQVVIDRAKEQARSAEAALEVHSKMVREGYDLSAFISAEALTGFDPVEHPRLGFTYAVIDREIGEQTFAVGGEFPYQNDPSLWGTLEFTR